MLRQKYCYNLLNLVLNSLNVRFVFVRWASAIINILELILHRSLVSSYSLRVTNAMTLASFYTFENMRKPLETKKAPSQINKRLPNTRVCSN